MMGLAKVLGKDSVRGKDTSEIKINLSELNSTVDSILRQVSQLNETIRPNALGLIEEGFGPIPNDPQALEVQKAFRKRVQWLQNATRQDIINLLEEAYETIQAPFEVNDNE